MTNDLDRTALNQEVGCWFGCLLLASAFCAGGLLVALVAFLL